MSNETPLTNFQIFFYKYKLKFLKIIGNLKLLIALTTVLLVVFYGYAQVHLKREFRFKSEEITKNVALIFEMAEEDMREKLFLSGLFFEEQLTNANLLKPKLIELIKKLNIFGVDVYNKAGFMVLTDANIFYKDASVIDLKECATQMCDGKLCRTTQSEILNCKIRRSLFVKALKDPNTFYDVPITVPMVFTFYDVKKMPAKSMHFYSSKLEKIISLLNVDTEINKPLEAAIKLNKDLKYIAIKDGNGNLITEVGKQEANSLKIEMPFGRQWHFNIEGQEVIYSYKIYTEFLSKNLEKEIWFVRILFILLLSLSILTLVVLKKLFSSKEKGMQMLKEMIKEKK